jgi:hypothetical protein
MSVTTLPERLARRISVTSDCWLWVGYRNADGYGITSHRNRTWKAHRLIYTMLVAPIPDGLTIDHLCRQRCCVNPAHMEPVPFATNSARGNTINARNGAKTHCPQGHEYTEANTYIEVRGTTRKRNCRTCKNTRRLAAYYRNRAAAAAGGDA